MSQYGIWFLTHTTKLTTKTRSHKIFFATQQQFLPIIHPGNYMRAFHSPPHMRPPMCLQYAIWTAASNAHSKYGLFHDALYRRARQYLEADEQKVSQNRSC